jgi:hypothetical protein
MESMMNGYHFDMAKDGANEYSVKSNGRLLISGSNFKSAFNVYKYIEESIENAGTFETVELIKDYDAKQKKHVEEVVKTNAKKLASNSSQSV